MVIAGIVVIAVIASPGMRFGFIPFSPSGITILVTTTGITIRTAIAVSIPTARNTIIAGTNRLPSYQSTSVGKVSIMSDENEEDSDDFLASYDAFGDIDEADELTWAEDVMFVYQNIGRVLTPRQAGTPARYMMHKLVANPKHVEKFLSTTVLKASEIKKKYQRSDSDEEMMKKEHKTITELKEILAEAIESSAEIAP